MSSVASQKWKSASLHHKHASSSSVQCIGWPTAWTGWTHRTLTRPKNSGNCQEAASWQWMRSSPLALQVQGCACARVCVCVGGGLCSAVRQWRACSARKTSHPPLMDVHGQLQDAFHQRRMQVLASHSHSHGGRAAAWHLGRHAVRRNPCRLDVHAQPAAAWLNACASARRRRRHARWLTEHALVRAYCSAPGDMAQMAVAVRVWHGALDRRRVALMRVSSDGDVQRVVVLAQQRSLQGGRALSVRGTHNRHTPHRRLRLTHHHHVVKAPGQRLAVNVCQQSGARQLHTPVQRRKLSVDAWQRGTGTVLGARPPQSCPRRCQATSTGSAARPAHRAAARASCRAGSLHAACQPMLRGGEDEVAGQQQAAGAHARR